MATAKKTQTSSAAPKKSKAKSAAKPAPVQNRGAGAKAPKKVVTKPAVKKTPIIAVATSQITSKSSPSLKSAEPVFTLKKAVSSTPSDVLYKIRTFVGWSAFVALAFAGLSMLSDYSTPGVSKLSGSGTQASVLTADKNGEPIPASLQQPAPVILSTSAVENSQVTLTAVGDVMLARFIEKKMKKLNDFEYPFALTKDFLSASDITFGNLESPFFPGLTTVGESTTFRADERGVEGLTKAGFDVLSLANNHIMNYRVAGLNTTLEALKKAGIMQVGAGQNSTEARAPKFIEVKDQKIAFLAYIDETIAPKNNHGEATDTTAGIAAMNVEQMKLDVAQAKSLGATAVVVSMHAGIEYRKEPTQIQKDFAHAAIDAGASVVIGHHPHIVEPVERYGKGIIMYSLGNFVFDQLFSDEVKLGLVAKIVINADGTVGAEFFPSVNDKLQARLLEGQERIDALAKMGVPASL